jgi:hypothetical protein
MSCFISGPLKLIKSHLQYGVISCDNFPVPILFKPFKKQKCTIRTLCGLQFNESCKRQFVDLKILTLPCLYIYEILIFFKIHIKDSSHNTVLHNYSTRKKEKILRPKKHVTALFEKSVSFAGLKLFNMLSYELQNLNFSLLNEY